MIQFHFTAVPLLHHLQQLDEGSVLLLAADLGPVASSTWSFLL